MKRDMDLVRKILFVMEADEKQIEFTGYSPIKVEGYKREIVSYHMKIMAQAGLLHVDLVESMTALIEGFQTPKNETTYYSISWEGHEFLDAARDNKRWEKAKGVMNQVGGFVFDVGKQLLVQYLKQELNLT